MTINQLQDEIIEDFAIFDDWFDKYSRIIELGNELPAFPEQKKLPENLIEGCQSKVWIDARLDENGLVVFSGDSDAVIVKGILALLLHVVSNHTPQEIIETDLYFINEIGLKEHLSPTRSNGLLAMVKQLKFYAIAFQSQVGK
jgi:cysteine desulfuration protein SufE